MNITFILSARPPHPQLCRKRRTCQGQARPGRCAGLDRLLLTSGLKFLRAMDEDANGVGSKQRYLHQEKGKKAKAEYTKTASKFFQFTSYFQKFFQHFLFEVFTVFFQKADQYSNISCEIFPKGFAFFSVIFSHIFYQFFVIKQLCFSLKILAVYCAFFIKCRCRNFDLFIISFALFFSQFPFDFVSVFDTCSHWQEGNCVTIRRPAKGLALWKPEGRALGVSLLALK